MVFLDVSSVVIVNCVFEIVVGWFLVFNNLLDVSWLDELLNNCWLVRLDESWLLVVMLRSSSCDCKESEESYKLECHFIGLELEVDT